MDIRSLILFLYIGAACAQTDLSTADVLKSLPADLQGTVDDAQIQQIQNKTTQVLEEKCKNNGGPNAFNDLTESANNLKKCTADFLNFSVLNEEIETARPNGKVDEVFKKYCDKRPVYMKCFRNLTDTAKVCFNPEERENFEPLYNMTEQLAEFICYKDGDRIALFIAEKGPECLAEKGNAINECLNNTFSTPNFTANSFPEKLPEIAFGEKECNQLTKVQTCIVSALEKCSIPTSANIIESLFKFARKSLPCKEFSDDDATDTNTQIAETTEKPNSGSRIAVTSLTITAAVLSKMFM